MDNKLLKLNNKFRKINNMGFIRSMRRGTTGVGYTFENLLGKPEENFPIPDFNDIEIKTLREKSSAKIHLLNITPDGDYLYPIKRIQSMLGYPDKNNPKYKVFNVDVCANEFKSIGYYKKIKLVVNRHNKKLDMVAINNKGENLNLNISWSFKLLEERLNLKLKILAVIMAESKFINESEYFYYKNISYYKLKDFDTFLNLIEKGIIIITFKIGVFKSGKRIGQIHDRGTSFSIRKEDINLLYEIISL